MMFLCYNYQFGKDTKPNMTEKRFQCDGCHRSYKHQSNLCNHKREECGKDPSYFCPFCSKGFKKKQHMQRHVVGIHGVPQPLLNSNNFSNPFPLNMSIGMNVPSNITSDIQFNNTGDVRCTDVCNNNTPTSTDNRDNLVICELFNK